MNTKIIGLTFQAIFGVLLIIYSMFLITPSSTSGTALGLVGVVFFISPGVNIFFTNRNSNNQMKGGSE